ncbi:hypothetical protein KDW_55960 [Dictyobacter vulcani]|uniref:Integrase catalytic domain-containing protein n=1 Tax=Dictyobacter vulcani TaxID=2607529 RepID=A0A5J4KPX8_9CHLR|nr:DDE-type integrase/transposase/recombinase [Dictyobacter vulcani]GER91434.1 hypothetical protein KDW_55960 [Dictyobacter vulcani]
MAVSRRRPQPGLLHHFDRGSQYTSSAYQDVLAQTGLIVSMSRTGNWYDKAPRELFWSTLKWESISGITFPTRALA